MSIRIRSAWCAVVLALLFAHPAATANVTEEAAAKPIRLAVVYAPMFSGLMTTLIDDFKKQSGHDVTIVAGMDIYDRARAGEADIVISHYGFSEVERFVQDGYGRWPRQVFSNQMVIIGPKDDPARIRGATSAIEAFRRLAEVKATFVPNALPAVVHLTDYLWEGAGRPDKTGWFLETTEAKGRAIKLAEEKGGYVIWGAPPFLQFAQKHETQLQILVANDPIFQRVMCSVVVNPDKVPGANAEGATAFERYLLSARAQALVAAFRTPDSKDMQLWWPAALHNDTIGAQ
ncbi:substrate-binding domain-containing protein [Hyphomicrobium sp.]|uniref:substrate-binding domain-containing protein n=1 Tax=Hyphomicrobium sp. TaxID=82 RepID=UPI002E342ECD|nr:substrate-binding domain-containing protein [Hyphomicrobium sp.]HEX2842257.1 substrate-binding domain-containing protein [Hyphomicrobium sp.]